MTASRSDALPEVSPATRAGRSLRQQALRGASWIMFSELAAQAVRLAGNVAAAHLLMPQAFGLMGLVTIARRGLTMFADVGLSPSIIRSDRGEDPAFLRTAWTIQIIRGVVLWLIACALAWPMAFFYGEAMLLVLLPVAAIVSLIGGFDAITIFVLNRRLQLGRISLLELTRQIINVAVVVSVALIWQSVWALVFGALAGAVYRLAVSHGMWRLPGFRHRPGWEPAAMRELLGFGVWIFMATALTFLATYADRLILGKLLTMELFGVFVIAYVMTEAPRALISKLNNRVVLPAISSRRDLPTPELRRKILYHRGRLLRVVALGLAGVVCVGDQIIFVLYDERYVQAGWMLPVLAMGLWPKVLGTTLNPALLARGKPQFNTLGQLLKLIAILVALPAAFGGYGIVGAVAVIALADLPHYLTVLVASAREGLSASTQDLVHTVLFAVVVGAFVTARAAMGFGTPFSF
ncbi:MAG: oligosaccharide flippase family protein [Phycisphaeraceae bacterium]